MQILRKRIGVAAMALCLLVALAFGGALAVAAGGFPADGANTLKVSPTASQDEAFVGEIGKADIVVDVYKVADATPNGSYVTYDYALTQAFAGLGSVDFGSLNAAGWQKLADSAAKLVTADTAKAGQVAADGTAALTLPDDGVYLLMPHGSGETLAYGDAVADSLVAKTETHAFVFAPSLTAAPTKEADESGAIGTSADYGDWTRDIQVTLKPEMQPLYGDLVIVKQVTGADGSEPVPAAFEFLITGTTPDGGTFSRNAMLNYTGGASETVEVTHIPAGTVVTVTEEYDGAGYEKVSGDGSTATIVADEQVQAGTVVQASVTFVNKVKPEEPIGGHGIENNFELVKTGEAESAWDWKWTAVPSDGDTAEER